jgi:hypothetical protein
MAVAGVAGPGREVAIHSQGEGPLVPPTGLP